MAQALTKDEKRKLMAAARQRVKAFFKGVTNGMAHLGELPTNLSDARRIIIALQDLYEESKARHHGATVKVAELKDQLDSVATITATIINDANFRIQHGSKVTVALNEENKMLRDEIARLNDNVEDLRNNLDIVIAEANELNEERDTMIDAVRIMSRGA